MGKQNWQQKWNDEQVKTEKPKKQTKQNRKTRV
jgi:hypothetical protein